MDENTLHGHFSLFVNSPADLLYLEKYIRGLLECESSTCSFLQSADYISFKHEVSRWLLKKASAFRGQDDSQMRHKLYIPNTHFVILQSVISSDNLCAPSTSHGTCFVMVKDISIPLCTDVDKSLDQDDEFMNYDLTTECERRQDDHNDTQQDTKQAKKKESAAPKRKYNTSKRKLSAVLQADTEKSQDMGSAESRLGTKFMSMVYGIADRKTHFKKSLH